VVAKRFLKNQDGGFLKLKKRMSGAPIPENYLSIDAIFDLP
jgi:hypothetical protein